MTVDRKWPIRNDLGKTANKAKAVSSIAKVGSVWEQLCGQRQHVMTRMGSRASICGHVCLPKGSCIISKGKCFSNSIVQARRFLSYPLPPGQAWQWMCGGMSMMDGLLVLFWLALQVTWVVASVQRKLPNLRGTARCLIMG